MSFSSFEAFMVRALVVDVDADAGADADADADADARISGGVNEVTEFFPTDSSDEDVLSLVDMIQRGSA